MRELLENQMKRMPEMQIQDAVKFIFQSEYGPGHLLKNQDYAVKMLKEEIELTKQDQAEIVPISDDLVRLNLGGFSEADIPLIIEAMIKTAEGIKPDRKQFYRKLDELKEMNLFSKDELNSFLEDYVNRDSLMISHSDHYRALYQPHYRILKKEYAEDILNKGGKAMKIKLDIKAENHEIPAILTLPDVDEKSPVVVLCHGTGSNKDEAGNLYVELAEKLKCAGIASIRFDFIGNGDSTEDYIGYTLTSAVEDVKTVVNYIKNHSLLDEDRMGIVGFSQGGSVAALSVGEVEELKCMVGWSSALSLMSLADDEMRKTAETQGWAWLNFDFRSSVRLSKQWMDEAEKMDVLSVLSKRGLPLLGIAGTLDTVVPWECSKQMVEATHHPDSELMLVEGDHIFSVFEHDKVWPKVIEKTTEWLGKML